MVQKQRGRPRKIQEQVVDWETLAKNLQLALEKEMDENEQLQKQKDHLSANVLKLVGVVEYLERKIGNSKL
jgi:ABC-type nitrate/sulfonate/bicarbonate transport system ATPase subunit